MWDLSCAKRPLVLFSSPSSHPSLLPATRRISNEHARAEGLVNDGLTGRACCGWVPDDDDDIVSLATTRTNLCSHQVSGSPVCPSATQRLRSVPLFDNLHLENNVEDNRGLRATSA